MRKEESKINWPDDVRLKMLDKGQFYEPNEKIYHYGYYDGYQHASEKSSKDNEELRKELEKEQKAHNSLIGERSELKSELRNIKSQLQKERDKAVRFLVFVREECVMDGAPKILYRNTGTRMTEQDLYNSKEFQEYLKSVNK